jgi:hypothetical protein
VLAQLGFSRVCEALYELVVGGDRVLQPIQLSQQYPLLEERARDPFAKLRLVGVCEVLHELVIDDDRLLGPLQLTQLEALGRGRRRGA